MRRSVSRSVSGENCSSLRMSRTRALLKVVDAWVEAYAQTPSQIAYAESDSLEQENVPSGVSFLSASNKVCCPEILRENSNVSPSKAEFAGSPLHLKSTKLTLIKGKPNYYPKEHMEMLTEIDSISVNKQGTQALDVDARETNTIQTLQKHTFSQAPSETTNLVDFICENCESYNVLQCNRLVCQICGFRCILDLDDLRDDTNLANLAASFWNSLSSSSKTRDDIVNREKDDRLKRQHTTSTARS